MKKLTSCSKNKDVVGVGWPYKVADASQQKLGWWNGDENAKFTRNRDENENQ